MTVRNLQTGVAGLRTERQAIDVVADNLANINTIRPYDQPAFQARSILATAVRGDNNNPPGVGGGVAPTAVVFGDPQGRTRYEPDHPFANAEGFVRYPDIDLSDQMTQLLMAQRAYQLNLAVVDRARDAYLQALNINGR